MAIPDEPAQAASQPSRIASASHRFAKGQAVRLKTSVVPSKHIFEITASLPPLGALPQYRIRSSDEQFDRVATELDLEPVEEISAAMERASVASRLA